MAPINLPDGTEVSEVILPDGSTASEVIAPDGSTVLSAIPDSGDYQWYIDEGSGSTLNPDVGSVTATTSGGLTWVSDSTAVGGYHLSHDGTDDAWQTDSGVLTTPFTVCGWVRFDDMTAFDNPIASNSDITDSDRPDDFYVGADGGGALLTLTGPSSRIRGQNFPTAGNWGFFALLMESSQHRLITFSNSQELADNTNSNGLSRTNVALLVGEDRDGGFLTGDTDFYTVAEGSLLTKTEITDLWEATQR